MSPERQNSTGRKEVKRKAAPQKPLYFVYFAERGMVEDHELHQKEVVCTTFLSIASRDLREGRTLHALAIFKALSRIEFTRKRFAMQGEAAAQVRLGLSKEAFTDAEKKYHRIIEMNQEPTVYKADNLLQLAEVSIVLQHFEEVDTLLEEAARIYEHQGLPKPQGSAIHLQAIVSLWREDYKAAMERLAWSTTLSEIKIPEIVPSGFSIEAPAEISMPDQSTFLALAGVRS